MSLTYLLFLVAAVLLPGAGLQRWLRLRIDPALVIPLGAIHAAVAHWSSTMLGAPWLFLVLTIAAAVGLLAGRPSLADPLPRGLWAPVVVLLALLVATQFGGNRPLADGGFRLDPMGDQPLHAGLTWELNLPDPQVPGLAGVPVSYHVGADLVRAAAVRWARVRPYGPLNREEPAFWAIAVMLSLAAIVRRLGGTPLAVALAPWTVLLTDLSFVAALLGEQQWWCDTFKGNVLISLVFGNPLIAALAVAFGALLALSRYEDGEGAGWLVLAIVQAAAVPWFKVFLGAHLGLALGVAVAAGLWRARSGGGLHRGLVASMVTAVAVAAAASPLLTGGTGEHVSVSFEPFQLVAVSLAQLQLLPASSLGLALATIPWLVVSLGLRLTGIAAAWRACVGVSSFGVAIGALALSGWVVGLALHVAPKDMNGLDLPPAEVYFFEQSGVVLWVFAVLALGLWARSAVRVGWVCVALVALALPSTLEFAVRKAKVSWEHVPAASVRALEAIAADGQLGDVVLQRPGARYPPLPSVLTGRRVVLERFTPYLTQFAPREELQRRHDDLFLFFRTTDREVALGIARKYSARYLCLYGTDRVRFDTTGILVPVHEEEEARAYRIDYSAAQK